MNHRHRGTNYGVYLLLMSFLAAPSGCRYEDGRPLAGARDRRPEETAPFASADADAGADADGAADDGTDASDAVAAASPDAPTWVSWIGVYACDSDPAAVVLPRGHEEPRCHERVALTLGMDLDGDSFDVAGQVLWGAEDPSWIGIRSYGAGDDLVAVAGSSDLFDGDGETEPTTGLWACVVNDCPGDAGPDCQPIVCETVAATGVVNLEGGWRFSGATFSSPYATRTIAQDGRRTLFLEDDAEGEIQGARLTWEKDGYLYAGTVASDRATVSGTVYHELTLSPIGLWTASR